MEFTLYRVVCTLFNGGRVGGCDSAHTELAVVLFVLGKGSRGCGVLTLCCLDLSRYFSVLFRPVNLISSLTNLLLLSLFGAVAIPLVPRPSSDGVGAVGVCDATRLGWFGWRCWMWAGALLGACRGGEGWASLLELRFRDEVGGVVLVVPDDVVDRRELPYKLFSGCQPLACLSFVQWFGFVIARGGFSAAFEGWDEERGVGAETGAVKNWHVARVLE